MALEAAAVCVRLVCSCRAGERGTAGFVFSREEADACGVAVSGAASTVLGSAPVMVGSMALDGLLGSTQAGCDAIEREAA